MITWLLIIIISFAIIFAINSSIHSFLVVKYAASDKVAVSVGLYYMSNALGRLMGTLGSGFIYTYAGDEITSDSGYFAGTDARVGLAACFVAGTVSSLLAAVITLRIRDDDGGLMCGGYTIIDDAKALKEDPDFDETRQQQAQSIENKSESTEGQREAEMRAQVEALVASTNAGKTAGEMLQQYRGREEELLSHLRQLEELKSNEQKA